RLAGILREGTRRNEFPARWRRPRAVSVLRSLGRQFQPDAGIRDPEPIALARVSLLAHGANAAEDARLALVARADRHETFRRQSGRGAFGARFGFVPRAD